MTYSSGQRRLAAIMFTDMVGYSALAQRNEALALELIAEQRNLLHGLLPEHGGREVKSMGDGYLFEFPSALAAIQFAIGFQKLAAARNATAPAERRFAVRVGVHVGDVVMEGDDIHGDGVNIAARIQPIAQPGGICLSRAVVEQVANKIDLPTVKLPPVQLKNIRTPVEVYRVVLPWLPDPDTGRTANAARRLKRWWPQIAGLLLLLTLAGSMAFIVGRQSAPRHHPRFHQLTSPSGTVHHARFFPDGRDIAYSARWNGQPLQIFAGRADASRSLPIGLKNADLLAISSQGEMAVLLEVEPQGWFVGRGTLARIPAAGGAPREWIRNVQEADWSPDGSEIAVVRWVGGTNRLEYPADQGKALWETSGYLSAPRVSPDGKSVAFLEHPTQWDNRGWVAVVDRAGHKRRLSNSEWVALEGLAWTPDGKELWFSASTSGEPWLIRAVTLSGKERVVANAPIGLTIHDISRDRRVLLDRTYDWSETFVQAPGEPSERKLASLENCQLGAISADGRKLVVTTFNEGSGSNYSTLRAEVDGTPAVCLGEGASRALSPDGDWVAVLLPTSQQVVLRPCGPGEVSPIPTPGLQCSDVAFLPDGRRVVLTAREPGQAFRLYLQELGGGKPEPISGEICRNQFSIPLVSPDGQLVFAQSAQGQAQLFPVGGGQPRIVEGIALQDRVVGWSSDGKSLFVHRGWQFPLRVERHNLETGTRQPWKELTPSDLVGISGEPVLRITPDGQAYAYSLPRLLSRLFVADGME